MPEVEVSAYKCSRCGHIWMPRDISWREEGVKPAVCPKCKSPYWDRPKKKEQKNE